MIPTNTKKRISLLSIALGSLIVTSLSTGMIEALPFNCTLQCSKSSVAKDQKRLDDCASKCDNVKIMDILLPHAAKLNEANQKHFQAALQYQQSAKQKEHAKIEAQLKTELAKKKPSKSKIDELNKKQDKLINEINMLGNHLKEKEQTSKAPPRPTGDLPLSEPPSDMPPSLPPHLATQSPTDEKPTEGVHGHQESAKGHEEPKKGNIPTPPSSAPVLGQNPRAILKAELLAQNPGKKPFEIDAMLKQKLETDHAGKSPAEINQALKEDQDVRYGGKSHKEILDSLKAAGPQTPSGSPTVTPSKTTDELSPQASRKTTTGAKPEGNIMNALSGLGNNPTERLKKFDPEAEAKRKAAAEEKLKNNPRASQPAGGDMFSDLKSALDKRRVGVAGDISPKDKETLDNLLNNQKKTPQEIRVMMEGDDGWDLFEDNDKVEKELKELERNK